MKIKKTVRIKGFLLFLLDDGRIQNRMRTCDNNGSGSGSGRPKNMRIRIPNTGSLEFFRCLTSRFLYECEGVQYVCLGVCIFTEERGLDRQATC